MRTHLKPARRQAYRYGRQVAELHNGGHGDASEQVLQAFAGFMQQFKDESDKVIHDWLINEFILGKSGDLALSGFVTNEYDGTITKLIT